MDKIIKKRISVTLPQETVTRLNQFIPRAERSAVIADLIEDYLDELEAVYEQEDRVAYRRQQRQMWLERIRASGQKAADLFLP